MTVYLRVHQYASSLLTIRIGCTIELFPLTTVILRNNVKEMKMLFMINHVNKIYKKKYHSHKCRKLFKYINKQIECFHSRD